MTAIKESAVGDGSSELPFASHPRVQFAVTARCMVPCVLVYRYRDGINVCVRGVWVFCPCRCGHSNTGLSALNLKDKGSNPGNLPNSNPLLEIGQQSMDKILSPLGKFRFKPRSIRLGFVVHKVALGQVFVQYFSFPPSLPFHQCSILISIYMLLLPEGDSLRAGRSGDRISVRTKFSIPVQTGPGTHPAAYTIGTGFFPGVSR
jgi:hypothetical protein